MNLTNFYDFFRNELTTKINPNNKWYRDNLTGINIFYANVNRMISDKRRETFCTHIESFQIVFDVFVLVETFYEDEVNVLKIPNYDDYQSIRQGHGGGVSIYVRQALNSHIKLSKIVNGNEFIIVNIPNAKLNVLGFYKPLILQKIIFYSL